jgi:hypothetical protein
MLLSVLLQEPADLAAAAAEQHAGSKRPHSSNVYSLFAAWFAPQKSLEMVGAPFCLFWLVF